jgi:hypothetical protein
MFCYCICTAIVQPAIVSDTRKKDQSEVDAVIIKALAKVSHKFQNNRHTCAYCGLCMYCLGRAAAYRTAAVNSLNMHSLLELSYKPLLYSIFVEVVTLDRLNDML